MVVNYRVCDHCGKKLENDLYADMECYFANVEIYSTDLCEDCVNEISEYIEKFCNKSKKK